jgi:hypothetical protein
MSFGWGCPTEIPGTSKIYLDAILPVVVISKEDLLLDYKISSTRSYPAHSMERFLKGKGSLFILVSLPVSDKK